MQLKLSTLFFKFFFIINTFLPYFTYFKLRFFLAFILNIFILNVLKINFLGKLTLKKVVMGSIIFCLTHFVCQNVVSFAQVDILYFYNRLFFWMLYFFSSCFQVLNEEILRYFFILKVSHRWNVFLSIFFALIFGVMHFIFYFFNFEGSFCLSFLCVFNLSLFCFLTNELMIKTKNIFYSFCVHAGWNSYRFAGVVFILKSKYLSEAESFNAIEGSLRLTAVLFVGAILMTGFFCKNSFNKEKITLFVQ